MFAYIGPEKTVIHMQPSPVKAVLGTEIAVDLS